MATNNAINTGVTPLAVSQGGTGASSMATTDGIVYYDGTKLVTTSAGTAAQVMTSNGAGVAPTYQAASVGPFVLLQSQTASASNSIAFTSTYITSTYKIYMVQFQQLIPGTDSVTFNMDWSTDNGGTYLNSNYQSGTNTNVWNSATQTNTNSATTSPISNTSTVKTASGLNGYIYLYNLAVSSSSQPMYVGMLFVGGSFIHCFGWNSGNPNINNIKFSMSSGTISTGVISLYGQSQ